METIATVRKSEGSHYYWPDGTPAYEIGKKSGKGMKKPNIIDARELGLVPGVTTILKVLHKQALQEWLIAQAVMAVMTTPRNPGEELDAFIERVLHTEAVQDQEAKTARDRGTAIHDAIELAIQGKEFDPQWIPFIDPVLSTLNKIGKVIFSEKIIVGDGYAGRADIGLENDANVVLIDFKTAKTMPKKEPWLEHKLQTAAYAKGLGTTGDKHVLTGNIYISTSNPGETALFVQEDWQRTYLEGFKPLLKYWQWANNYRCGVAE